MNPIFIFLMMRGQDPGYGYVNYGNLEGSDFLIGICAFIIGLVSAGVIAMAGYDVYQTYTGGQVFNPFNI